MHYSRTAVLATTLLIAATPLARAATLADAVPGEGKLGWDGEAELGVVNTSGNSETSTVNAKFSVVNERRKWRNTFHTEYLLASDTEQTTAERFVAEGATNYKLSEHSYLLVLNLRYVKDRFAGIDRRLTESMGYGHIFNWDHMKLNLEGGLGARQTNYVDGTSESDAIIRLAGDYRWQFSKTGELAERAFTEIGESNTHSESETALKLHVYGNLATKISYKIINDTEVPAGRKKTDTISAVTLVYDF